VSVEPERFWINGVQVLLRTYRSADLYGYRFLAAGDTAVGDRKLYESAPTFGTRLDAVYAARRTIPALAAFLSSISGEA
jgi:hypothetical protein